jgi:hypothetical protein
VKLLPETGPYRIREAHEFGEDAWGPWRPLNQTLKRVKVRMVNAPLGTKLVIAPTEGDSYTIRKVEIAPPIIDTVGNERIDRIYTLVFRNYSFAQNWGIFNCRPVAGSSTWSQHSWANALDVGASTMDQLWTIANRLVEEQKEGRDLEGIVYTVICGNRIWRKDLGWNPYTGIYHTHVHVDAYPNFDGRPPCA